MRWVFAVLLFAACGDGTTVPDAAPPTDGPTGLVRVRYRGGILDGHPVFFQNADGSLALATRTDADGKANAYMAPGGFVTLVDVKSSTQFLSTWAAVHPGDEIVVDDPQGGAVPGTTTIILSVEVDPGAQFYQLQSSCGSENVSAAAGTSLVITLGDCGSRADMLVYTVGNEFRYSYTASVPVADLALVSLTGPYRPLSRASVSAQGADARVAELEVRQRIYGEKHFLFEETSEPFGFASMPLVDGSGLVEFDVMQPPAPTLTQVSENPGAAIGVQRFASWGPPATFTPLDLRARALRRYATRPHYDPLAHAITWTEEPSGVVPGAVIASYAWFRPEIGGNYQWRVFGPRGAEPRIQLPVLPDPQYLVRAGDSVVDPFELVSIGVEGGYDRIRTTLPSLWPARRGTTWPAESIDTPTGSLVYQQLGAVFEE